MKLLSRDGSGHYRHAKEKVTVSDPERGKETPKNKLAWVLLFLIIIVAVESISYYSLPQPKTLKGTNNRLPEDTFNSDNAFRYLQGLTGLGTRVTGSFVNEIITTQWLEKQIAEIMKQRSHTAENIVMIDYNIQHPSSQFYLDFLGGITNIYQKVTNIAVKVSWPNTSPKHGILINAHFDTIPGSPGASDDGVGVAVMLEMLRAITSNSSTPLDYPVVFLFNGAEEWNHQAAHWFITQHPWSPELQYIINLEAIGAGGREMVFQCNSGYLASVYGKSAPYPYASVVAHEMFKHFLYQFASSDWKTLIQYGKHRRMRGLDTAYTTNGYVYHTLHDNTKAVPIGTIQNTGENMINLVRTLGTLSKKKAIEPTDDIAPSPSLEDEQVVFFDIFNRTMVVYRGHMVLHIHLAILVFAAASICYMMTSYNLSMSNVWQAYLDELYCVGVSATAATFGGLISWILFPMRWYDGGIAVAILLYLSPLVLCRFYCQGILTLKPYHSPMIRKIGCLSTYVILALPMVIFRLNSAFILCLWVLFITLGIWSFVFGKRVEMWLKLHYFSLHPIGIDRKAEPSIVINLVAGILTGEAFFLLTLTPIVSLYHRMAHTLLDVMIPLLGKSGTVVPADIVLAAVMALQWSTYVGTLTTDSITKPFNFSMLRKAGTSIVITYALIGCSFAYRDCHPKRLWIYHIERRFQSKLHGNNHFRPNNAMTRREYDRGGIQYEAMVDQGLYVLGFDTQGLKPIDLYLSDFVNEYSVNNLPLEDYKRLASCEVSTGECYGSFPWYFPVADALRDSVYIPTISAMQLEIDNLHQMEMFITDHSSDPSTRILEIELKGPSHINLVLRETSPGQQITRWYLTEEQLDGRQATVDDILPKLTYPHPLRSEGIYFMEIGFGLCFALQNPCKKSVWLEVTGSEYLDVISYGHYVNNLDDPLIDKFIQRLPSWSRGAEWTKFPTVLIAERV